jgi:secretion/DNA translocation related TadE-like protein
VKRVREGGNVTILMIAALAFAALCGVGLARLGSATVHKARADTAADAAALAAADALASGGTSDDAEIAARRVARANGALLVWCACTGRSAEVTVRLGDAQARARAEIGDP